MTSKIGILCDHFDQGSVNSLLWTTPTYPSGMSLASVGTANLSLPLVSKLGRGSFTVSSTTTVPALVCSYPANGKCGVQSVASYDLTNSGLSVQMTSLTVGNIVQFSVGTPGGNNLIWQVDTGGNVQAWDSIGSPVTAVTNPAMPLYLRIRESSGTCYWDYSSDGQTWTNTMSESDPFTLTSVNVGLAIYGGGTNGVVSWGDVNYAL